MTKLRPRAVGAANFTTKMFSFDGAVSGEQFFWNVGKLSPSAYTAEAFKRLSTRFTAAWQASSPPATVMPAQELYAVALIGLVGVPSFVNTPALMYVFAKMASTTPRVIRPLLAASRVTGRSGRTASSSDSMNLNVESRVARGRALISGVVAIGAPPNMSSNR